jgi:hypothetical protein
MRALSLPSILRKAFFVCAVLSFGTGILCVYQVSSCSWVNFWLNKTADTNKMRSVKRVFVVYANYQLKLPIVSPCSCESVFRPNDTLPIQPLVLARER